MPSFPKRLLALSIGLLIAAVSASATEIPVYRHGLPEGGNSLTPPPADPASPPGMTPGMVRGDGDLALFAPLSVRARPGISFEFRALAPDAVGSVSWSLIAGDLPGGLAFEDGAIQGLPGSSISLYPGFMISGVDENGREGRTPTFAIDVRPLPSLSIAGFTEASAGTPLRIETQVSDVYGSAVWTVKAGSLPVGLAVENSTGAVAGTPLETGIFQDIVLGVIDADGATAETQPFTIQVTGTMSIAGVEEVYGVRMEDDGLQSEPLSLTSPLSATPSSTSTTSSPIRITPSVAGAEGAVLWSIATAGSQLPAGMSLDPATGVVTGIPSGRGVTGPIYLVATDLSTGAAIASRPFTVKAVGDPTAAIASIERRTGSTTSHMPQATNLIGSPRWIRVGSIPSSHDYDLAQGRFTLDRDWTIERQNLQFQLIDTFDGRYAFTNPFSIKIWPQLAIQANRIPGAIVDQPYPLPAPALSGLRGTASWQVVGTLPQGLTANPDGSLSGTPTVAGSFPLTWRVTDSADSKTAQRDFTISVSGTLPPASDPNDPNAPPPADTNSPPSFHPVDIADIGERTGRVGQSFSILPFTTGGSGYFSFSISVSRPAFLPAETESAFTGTPLQTGSYDNLVVTVTDLATGQSASTNPFGVTVLPGAEFGASLPSPLFTEIGRTFSRTPDYTNRIASLPLLASILTGTLPNGLELDPSTGRIFGTPTQIGTWSGITLIVREGAERSALVGPFTIAVRDRTLDVSALPATLAVDYGSTWTSPALEVSRETGQTSFSISHGTLPGWATLSAATGRISGSPTQPGDLARTDGLRIRVSDETGASATTNVFAIDVRRPQIIAGDRSLRTRNGSAATLQMSASGVVGTPTWSFMTAPPAGTTIDAESGLIASGAWPQGTHEFAVRVRDSADGRRDEANIVVEALAAPQIVSSARYQVRRDREFSILPTGRNLLGPASWAVLGPLPSWANVDPQSGRIHGTSPDLGETSQIIWHLVDSDGQTADSAVFVIETVAGIVISMPRWDFRARPEVSFSSSAPTAETSRPVTWSAETGLPAWASVDPVSGVIHGVPVDADVGTATVRLRASTDDGENVVSAGIRIDVLPRPVIAGLESRDLRVSSNVDIRPTTAHAVGARYWSVTSGELPSGLSISSTTGRIVGTPTTIGRQDGIVVRVVDGDGASSLSPPFSLDVVAGVTVAGLPPEIELRADKVLTPMAMTLVGSIGQPVWSLEQTPGPVAGISLTNAGVLQGTPGTIGTFGLSVRGIDTHDGARGIAAAELRVLRPLQITGFPRTIWGHVDTDLAMNAPGISGLRGAATWSLAEGSLPSWLSFDPQTGRFSGTTPVAQQVDGIVVELHDGNDDERVRTAATTVSILPPMRIFDMSTLYVARYGFPFIATRPSVTDAAGAVTWRWHDAARAPSWLNLDPTTGILSGVPDKVGETTGLVAAARDEAKYDAFSAPFRVQVYSEPEVRLPSNNLSSYRARVGDAFSLAPTGIGIVGTPSWSFVSMAGGLPQGLSVDPQSGLVSGTLAATGEHRFRLRVTDGFDDQTSTSVAVDLEVNPTLAITGLAEQYGGQLLTVIQTPAPTITGAVGAVTYSASNLPSGFSVNSVTGVVSGFAEVSINHVVTLRATDSHDSRQASFSMRIVSGNLSVSGVSNARVRAGGPLSGPAPTAVNATDPLQVQWRLDDTSASFGTLPAWAAIDSATGRLVGTAPIITERLTISNLRLRLRDLVTGRDVGSGSFSLIVDPMLSVSAPASASAKEGAVMTHVQAQAVHAIGTPVWTVAGLPPGLTFSNGRIQGTPAAGTAGSHPVTVSVRDPFDNAVAEASLAISISGDVLISSPNGLFVGRAEIGQPTVCNALLVSNAGSVAGSPVSMSFNDPDFIACTPAINACGGIFPAQGSCNLGIAVSTTLATSKSGVASINAGNTQRPGLTVSLSTTTAPFAIGVATSVTGIAYQSVSIQPTALLGSEPVQDYVVWSIIGTLPTGLGFDAITGRVSGVPVGPSSTVFRLRADYGDRASFSDPITLTIAERAELDIVLPEYDFSLRTNVSFTLEPVATNAMGEIRWEIVDGRLPDGLSFNDKTGRISGASRAGGDFSFALRVHDANRTKTSPKLRLSVAAGMIASTETVTTGNRAKKPYLARALSVGSIGDVNWTLVSGLLPPGIALDGDTGDIAGIPSSSGRWVFRLLGRDSTGALAEVDHEVVTGSAPSISQIPPLTAIVGATFSHQVSGNHVLSPANWAWAPEVSPPAGLSVDPVSGLISGTPTVAGTFNNLRIGVTDADGLVALSNSFSFTGEPQSNTFQVSAPGIVDLKRGEPILVSPVVSSAPGSVTYRLEAYSRRYTSSCTSSYISGLAWSTSNTSTSTSYDTCRANYQSFALPPGLNFNTTTGVISGTPTTAALAPSNSSFTPLSYRIVATSGGTSTTSGQIVFNIENWLSLEIDLAPTLYLERGTFVSQTPSVANLQGSVTYRLEAYSRRYTSSCTSSYISGLAWSTSNTSTASSYDTCRQNYQSFALPPGLGFNTSTGVISGTPTDTTVAPSNSSFTPLAYRIVAVETRQGQVTETVSKPFTVKMENWPDPKVTVPGTITLKRGEPLSMMPTVTNLQGSVTYRLEAYSRRYTSSCTSSYISGFAWSISNTSTSTSYDTCRANYQSFALPPGLSFSTTTGAISGTPTNATVAPWNSSFTPLSYRIVAVESRQGQQIETTSNQFIFEQTEWEALAISVDQSVVLDRGVPVHLAPSVTNLQGSVSYRLEAYSRRYTSSCTSSYISGLAWSISNTSTTTSYDTCQQNYQSFALPPGLNFNTSTGLISGTPTTAALAPLSSSFTPLAYRIVAVETRQGQVLEATSGQIVFTATDWAGPVVTFPTQIDLVQNVGVSFAPILSNVNGGITYRLEAYSRRYTSSCTSSYISGLAWSTSNTSTSTSYDTCRANHQSFALPPGLNFNTTTGVISGTPTTAALAPSNSSFTPRSYRIVAVETRLGQITERYSDQFTFRALTEAPTQTLSYARIEGRIGETMSVDPVLSGTEASGYTMTFVPGTRVAQFRERLATALPSGLSFDATTGRISGTPLPGSVSGTTSATSGIYRGIRVCASTANGPVCADEVVIDIKERVLPIVSLPPYPTGEELEPFSVGTRVTGNFVEPLTYTLLTGQNTAVNGQSGDSVLAAPPAGLSFDSTTGILSGTPTTQGTYRGYRVRVRDAENYTVDSRELLIRIEPRSQLKISHPTVIDVTVDRPMPTVFPVLNGQVGSVTFNSAVSTQFGGIVDGANGDRKTTSLPAGISYDAGTGSFFGMPLHAAGGWSWRGYRVCGRDERNITRCSNEVIFRVGHAAPLDVAAPLHVFVAQGDPISISASANNAIGAFTFNTSLTTGFTTAPTATENFVLSSPPTGLAYAAGTISGAPTAAPGRYRGYRICGVDSGRSGSHCTGEIVIEILPRESLEVRMPSVIDARVGTAMTQVAPQVTGAIGAVTFSSAPRTGRTTAVHNHNGDMVTSYPAWASYSQSGGFVGGTPATGSGGTLNGPGTRWRGYDICATDSIGRTACSNEFMIHVRP